MLCLLVALQPRENHNRLKSLNILFRPGSEEPPKGGVSKGKAEAASSFETAAARLLRV